MLPATRIEKFFCNRCNTAWILTTIERPGVKARWEMLDTPEEESFVRRTGKYVDGCAACLGTEGV